MHRLWSIPEIVSFILDFLRLSDQARMAQVSRHIWERSVPFVWRDLPDIYMLVEPFPPEKQPIAEGTKRQQSEEDELLHDEVVSFSRFSFYARLVRAISLTLDSYTYGDLKLLATRRPLTSSLPNLKTLIVTVGDLVDAAQAELIPSTLYLPSLTTLEICPMNIDEVDEDSCDSLAFLTRAIPETHFPKLETLSIELPVEGEIESECLAGAVRACQGLKQVVIKTVDDTLQLEEALKTLPLLRILQLAHWQLSIGQDSSPPPPITTTGFPSLHHLTLTVTPAHLQRILRLIGSKDLESVDLTIEEDLDVGSTLSTALKELNGFEQLKELQLRCQLNFTWEDVQPVLSCHQLTKFSLLWTWLPWITINGGHLDAMAKAWPNLIDLTITNVNTPISGNPLIKLADLFDLTKDLTSLQNLHISFDSRRQGQEQTFDEVKNGDVKPANTNLKWLDVGWSLKDRDPDAVSALDQMFSVWWPNLREVRSSPGLGQGWRGVKDLIRRRNHDMELKGSSVGS